jgi:hypothetical protein
MVRGRHDDECEGGDCESCLPCPERHCLVQWHGERGDCETHAESVCPSCVGSVREHLAEIERLSGLPLVEQVLRAGDVDTEAADLLGPTADPAAWRQRGRHGHKYEPDSRIGELHPLWVLGRFDLLVTEHLGHKRTQRVGITSSAAYLSANLTYLAADLEFDFVDLANDVAACRSHLERVLHEGEQRETGAPCMDCRVPMVREWGKLAAADGWRCPRCREWRSEQDYRLNVADLHRGNAEWLTANEMQIRTGVKAGTVRVWCTRETVRSRSENGRTVYRVADVMRHAGLDDEEAS